MGYVLRFRDADSPEEFELSWSERRERAGIRVLQAMEAAGLTNRERDVYWLHVGCQSSYQEVGLLLGFMGGRLAAKTTAFRVFQSAETKLSHWVTEQGITASPLFQEPLAHKAVTTLALSIEGPLRVAGGAG